LTDVVVFIATEKEPLPVIRPLLSALAIAFAPAIALVPTIALLPASACAAPAPAPAPAPASTATPSPAPAAGTAAPIPNPPAVSAHAYILMDHFSGRVLAQDHADERAEPASLTKLMTAYVVFTALKEGRLKPDDMVTISEHAWRAEGSRTFVQVGSQIPVDILIKGMIVQSGNDATIALAERVGGTEAAFAQMMNEYARRLGMKASHFENSDGLPSPNHYTTARDVATLSNALIRDFPEHYPLFSLKEFRWNNIRQGNRNTLLTRDPSVDGLKTGHTDSAGFCLAASANRSGMRLVSVVMGSPSEKARADASAALLNYGYTFFDTIRLKTARETVLKPRIYKSASEFAAIGVPDDVYVTVARGAAGSLKTSAQLNKEPLVAPLAAGKPVGELTVADASGAVIERVPLVSLDEVPQGGLWTRAVDSLALLFH
jgi:D-alanyl-D-alanine carboxypeptidase (penicillin-binding protein 5/6)